MKKITLLFSFLAFTLGHAQSTANYNIVFESYWETPAGDPVNGTSSIPLPGGAHWSDLAIATHNTANSIFMMGGAASSGIEDIAEFGGTSDFVNEVAANPEADKSVIGSPLNSAQGTISKTMGVSSDFPFVSLLTMIAPSPDWIMAVNSENLRSGNNAINNGWKGTYTIDVFPYDAGTEDGSGYSTSNSATNPHGTITSLANVAPFNGVNSNMSFRIGTVTFNYLDSTLSTNKTNSLENLKIYPNPTNGAITISNIQNIELKTIEVYSVLGKLVKQFSVKPNSSKINLDLSLLNSGVYLLKMLKTNDSSHTQKLVIN